MNAELGKSLPLWSMVPFAGLLLCIAVLPLVREHWWENNRNKGIVAVAFGILPFLYFLYADWHVVLHTGLEYGQFIVLILSLFVVSGGIFISGDIRATPVVNTLFLLIGAVLANFIGTTGAAMLLIRPMLRTNQQRKNKRHIPVFFIFLVANIGGVPSAYWGPAPVSGVPEGRSLLLDAEAVRSVADDCGAGSTYFLCV